MTALTVYALLAGGLLLWPWHGTALAQQLDAAEVTNREYQEFILTTGRAAPDHWDGTTFPAGSEEEPVTMVTWYDARAYCAWRSKRLPSQEEWVQACHAKDFPKLGDIWEWTQSEANDWKVLCGPKGTCDCSHKYRPAWKNAVKGFRCTKDQPMSFLGLFDPCAPDEAGLGEIDASLPSRTNPDSRICRWPLSLPAPLRRRWGG